MDNADWAVFDELVKDNDIPALKTMLKMAEVADKNKMLLAVIQTGNLELTKELIDNGAPLNYVSRTGSTPLLVALGNSQLPIIDYLLSFPVVVSQLNDTTDQGNPMTIAAKRGSVALLEKLVGLGGRLNQVTRQGNTMLMAAATYENLEAMDWLAQHEVDLNQTNSQGKTALIMACEEGKFSTAQYLYQRGADQTIKDKSGKTAKDYAQESGNDSLMTLFGLVKKCSDKLPSELEGKTCDQYLQDKIGTTLATVSDDFPKIVQMLLDITRDYQSRPFAQTDYLNHWLKYLSTFPINSVNGVVGLAQLNNIKQDEVIFKFPQTGGDPVEWEFLVGSRLNELKPLTPNFVTTYGYFSCHADGKKLQDKTATQFCDSRLDPIFSKEFLLLEKVDSIGPFIDSVGDPIPVGEIASMIIQVLLSLHIANVKVDYTHFDLHGQNVLVEHINRPNEYLVYIVEGQVFTLPRTYLCKIIDFGRGHISNMPEKWDKYWRSDPHELAEWGVVPHVMKRMHDVADFLGFYLGELFEISGEDDDESSSIIAIIQDFFKDLNGNGRLQWEDERFLVAKWQNGQWVNDQDIVGTKYKTVLDVAKAFQPLLSPVQNLTVHDILYIYSENFSGKFDPKQSYPPSETDFVKGLGVYSEGVFTSPIPTTVFATVPATVGVVGPVPVPTPVPMDISPVSTVGTTVPMVVSATSPTPVPTVVPTVSATSPTPVPMVVSATSPASVPVVVPTVVPAVVPTTPMDISPLYNTPEASSLPGSPVYDNHRTGQLVTVAPSLPSFNHLQPKLQETKISQYAEPLPAIAEAVCEDLIGNKWSQTNLSFYAERLGISGDDLCNQVLAKQKDVYQFYRSEWEQVNQLLQQSPNDPLLSKRLEVAQVNLDAFA